MAIKLIAADMDGTILRNDKSVSAENIKAVRAAMDAGARFTLCSGRMLESVTPTSRLFGVNAPLICYNGALTYDEKTNKVVDSVTLEKELARDICRFAEENGIYVQCFWGGHFYYREYCEKTSYYEHKASVIGVKAQGILSMCVPEPCYKVLMIVDHGQMPETVEKVRERFGNAAVFQPSSDTFLECVASGVSKGLAMKRLCDSMGISSNEVMTFGDEQNDVSMLKYAYYGYAMENACDEVKSQCRFITDTNENDGVAKALYERLNAGEIGGKRA